MAQKRNPTSLRLEKTNKLWNSCWYGDYNYTQQLLQDRRVEAHIENICQQAKIVSPVVFMNRQRQQTSVFFFFSRQEIRNRQRWRKNKPGPVERSWLGHRFRGNWLHTLFFWSRDPISLSAICPGLSLSCLLSYFLLSQRSVSTCSADMPSLLHCAELFRQIGQPTPHLGPDGQMDWGVLALGNRWPGEKKRGIYRANKVEPSKIPGAASNRLLSRGSLNVVRNVASPWRNHLESCISAQTHHNSTLHFLFCPSSHQNPYFLASQLCFSLENRKTFRRLKDRLIQEISADSSIKGVRITCSGRVAARSKKAQKARTESIQWGQTSLNVFSDLVSFTSKNALTPFGKIGVKVWICYRKIKKANNATIAPSLAS